MYIHGSLESREDHFFKALSPLRNLGSLTNSWFPPRICQLPGAEAGGEGILWDHFLLFLRSVRGLQVHAVLGLGGF